MTKIARLIAGPTNRKIERLPAVTASTRQTGHAGATGHCRHAEATIRRCLLMQKSILGMQECYCKIDLRLPSPRLRDRPGDPCLGDLQKLAQIVGGDRIQKVLSLKYVAAHIGKAHELRARIDAVGNHAESEFVRKTDQRRYDRARAI